MFLPIEKRPPNIDLGKTQITDKIRVSSAAIFRNVHFGDYWLIETWVFSADPRQRNRQIIHGSAGTSEGRPPTKGHCEKAKKVHGHISANLLKKFGAAGLSGKGTA